MDRPIAMHEPPHPGEFIGGVYLEPCSLTLRQVAERLGVSASRFQRLVTGKSRVTPDMALQDNYDLWEAQQRLEFGGDVGQESPVEGGWVEKEKSSGSKS